MLKQAHHDEENTNAGVGADTTCDRFVQPEERELDVHYEEESSVAEEEGKWWMEQR